MEPNQNPANPAPQDEEPAVSHAPGDTFAPGGEAAAAAAPEPALPPLASSEPETPGRPMAVLTPNQTGMIINGKTVDSPSAALAKPPRRMSHKALLMPLVVALVLLGGSAAAYFGYYVPSKPENVLAKAFSNSLSQHQFTTQGTFNITSSGISGKIEYTIAVDEDSHAVDAKLNSTVSGVNFPVEIVSTKGNAYFKVGDLNSLYGVVNQFLGGDSADVKTLENQINSKVANQWYEVDSTLIKEAKLDCLSGYPAAFSQPDINSLKQSYKKSPFVTIGSHSSDSVNGATAIKYVLSIDDDSLAKVNLTSSGYFKNLQTCLKNSDPNTKVSLESFKDGDKSPVTIWVDKKSKQIIKYATQSTAKDKSNGASGDLSGTISYGKVNITTPANAKPVLSLLQSLDLGALSGSDLGVIPGSGSADIERKTDINAMQGHLEAYFADNGFYPTLADINNPTWRAANFKGLDTDAFKDPAGTLSNLAASPAAHVYSYKVTPAGCDNVKTPCTRYTLTATLDSGGSYSKDSLN